MCKVSSRSVHWSRSLFVTKKNRQTDRQTQTEGLFLKKAGHSITKRHSEGTFTSDYSKFLDNVRARDFVNWLMNSKRGSTPPISYGHKVLHQSVTSNLEASAWRIYGFRACLHLEGALLSKIKVEKSKHLNSLRCAS
uniref:Glucagon / GIP / secretin / VIP family domain-containing protein n=1 Tax=Eptatretus burgeri TaxID=7764 RepID=A0A8C4QET2_EPTBU